MSNKDLFNVLDGIAYLIEVSLQGVPGSLVIDTGINQGRLGAFEKIDIYGTDKERSSYGDLVDILEFLISQSSSSLNYLW